MALDPLSAETPDEAPEEPQLESDRDSGNVGMVVTAPSSPRSPGVLCYSLSPGSTPASPRGSPSLVPATPAPHPDEPAAVFPITPAAGPKTRQPRPPRPVPPPSRQSARLARVRAESPGVVPTVSQLASQRTAARNLDSGTPKKAPPSCPSASLSSPSGSRFSVLDDFPLEHLAQVAADSGVVFRGERGPRLEQIEAIRAREIYEGSLAAARARAARQQGETLTPSGTGTSDPGSEMVGSPQQRPSAAAQETPLAGGSLGRPPRQSSMPLSSRKTRSVPQKGTKPK